MNFPSIYLASQSPRRRELLTQMGVQFSTLSVEVDESPLANETTLDYVQRVALAKAQAGLASLNNVDKRPVLGSDTSVVVDDDILGKPRDEHHGAEMLKKLSNRNHQVITSVAIVTNTQVWTSTSISTVSFAALSDDDIAWYIATQEGVDKAGGYAVQGLAALFIDNIEGSYSGIMGLPIRQTGLLLRQIVAPT